MKQPYCLPLALSLFVLCSPHLRAQIIIDPTFESSITGNTNAAEIEAGIDQAISRLESEIETPITVSIDFASMGSGLGESSTYIGTTPYTTYLAQLTASATSADDATALASLSVQTNNPVNGDPDIALTYPLARALGYSASPPLGQPDGTISLNFSLMNLSRTGPQNPSFYDLQAVATHEMDEVLGIGGTGSLLNYAVEYNGGVTTGIPVGVMDLFRYSGPGQRSFTTSAAATSFFSINGGATNLVGFNQNGAFDNSDFGDWATGLTPQVQDAYGTPGVDINLGANEATALDVVGYTLTPAGLRLEEGAEAAPEPGAGYLLPIGLIALGIHRLRRQAA